MKKWVLFFIVLSLSINFASAVTYPNYDSQNKYVTDTANIINDVWETQLTSLCADIEKNTTAQIAIVTINSLEGLPIEQYSIELAEKWGIGQADVDNGLLILIAVEDHEYRIEVGYGLEGILNDAKVGRIGRDLFVDNFRAGNYGEGIFLAVQAIGQELSGEESIISQATDDKTGNTDIILFIFIVLIWTLPWLLRSLAKKYGKKVGDNKWMLWGMTFSMLGRGRGRFGGGGRLGGGGFGGFGGGGFGGGGSSGGW